MEAGAVATVRGQSFGLAIAMLATLSACSGGSDAGGAAGSSVAVADAPVVVSGSVGDGPVVGATLEVTDADGRLLQTDRSSETADYRLELAVDTRLPVLVRATGGRDLVTDRALDFPLLGAVLTTGNVTVNVSPLTTLAVEAARCSAEGLGATGLEAAWQAIETEASFGLDRALVADPMSDRVDEANVGTLVLANEALGETVRRTMTALAQAGSPLDGGEILRQFACDLMGDSRSGAVDPRVVAVFEAAALAVHLETLAGRLEVDGYSATARMDDAIRTIRPQSTVASVAALPIPDSARTQTAALVALWLEHAAEPALVTLAERLGAASSADLPAELDRRLDARLHGRLLDLPAHVALVADVELAIIADRRARQGSSAVPIVSFSADRPQIAAGESVTLSWAASEADRCVASGDWSGPVSSQGFQQIAGLTEAARFGLTCAGLGGVAHRETEVALTSAGPTESTPPTEAPSGAGTEEPSEPTGETGPISGPESGEQETEAPTEPASETPPAAGTQTGGEPTGSESGVETAPEGEPAPESSGSSGEPTGSEGTSGSTPPTEGGVETPPESGSGSGSEPAGSESGSETVPEGESASESSGSTEGLTEPPPEPAAPPVVDLDASTTAVAPGGSAMLHWTASDASACTASGGWAGTRPTAGMETVGPLQSSTTFTLSCTGAGGTDVAMISVAVNGSVALRWQPPTQLVDGTPLSGLSGYRIYYGTAAGSYLAYEEIGPEAGSEYSLQLPSGEYYIAMTAIGLDGAESAYSNEVHKIVD